MAFIFKRYQNGSLVPRIIPIVMKNDAVIDEGDMVEIDTAEAENGATASTTLFGVAAESLDNAADGLSIDVIDGYLAVFEVVDANARAVGDPLDINGTFDGVATNSNSDLVVVKASSATEKTEIMIRPASHIFTTAT